MGLQVTAALAVVITAQAGAETPTWAFCFMTKVYCTPYSMSTRIRLLIHKGVQYYEGMKRKRLPDDIREYFVRMGRIGGQKGVEARMAKVSPERRREIAQKAIAARWAKQHDGPVS
jgi:hypothetical protein